MGRLATTESSAAAKRGQIVQRVLVDGWDAAQAAAVFGVAPRDVARWVAAYRRHGMASLRDDIGSQPAAWRWLRRLRLALHRLVSTGGEAPSCAELAPFVLSHDSDARNRPALRGNPNDRAARRQ